VDHFHTWHLAWPDSMVFGNQCNQLHNSPPPRQPTPAPPALRRQHPVWTRVTHHIQPAPKFSRRAGAPGTRCTRPSHSAASVASDARPPAHPVHLQKRRRAQSRLRRTASDAELTGGVMPPAPLTPPSRRRQFGAPPHQAKFMHRAATATHAAAAAAGPAKAWSGRELGAEPHAGAHLANHACRAGRGP